MDTVWVILGKVFLGFIASMLVFGMTEMRIGTTKEDVQASFAVCTFIATTAFLIFGLK